MESKKLGFIVVPNEEEFENFMKDAETQEVERGLVVRLESNVGKNLFDNFVKVKNQGYFPVGIVIDKFNMEIIFQRHPNQKDENKMVEVKIPEELKYKL